MFAVDVCWLDYYDVVTCGVVGLVLLFCVFILRLIGILGLDVSMDCVAGGPFRVGWFWVLDWLVGLLGWILGW